jgi:hypothetical protein
MQHVHEKYINLWSENLEERGELEDWLGGTDNTKMELHAMW